MKKKIKSVCSPLQKTNSKPTPKPVITPPVNQAICKPVGVSPPIVKPIVCPPSPNYLPDQGKTLINKNQ